MKTGGGSGARDRLLLRGCFAVSIAALVVAVLGTTPLAEAALDAGYGAFSGARVSWATLQFTAEAAQWVQHEQWHPKQQSTLHDDGSLTLRVPYSDATELAMDILRHGEQVQVVAPVTLVRRVQAQIQAMATAYAAVGA